MIDHSSFRIAHASGSDGTATAAACVEQLGGSSAPGGLGFVYVTDHLAPGLNAIVDVLRRGTGISHWVGSVGVGICAGERAYFDEPAIAALATTLPAQSYCLLPPIRTQADRDSRRWCERLGGNPWAFGIVHADPAVPGLADLIEDLAATTSAFVVGGLTSSRLGAYQLGEGIAQGSLSAVLFSDDVPVRTGLTQGCSPIAQSHVITDGVDNVVITLDGRPALDVLEADLGPLLGGDLRGAAGLIHVALPLAGSDRRDYLVRTLIGFDPVRRWLAIGDQVTVGGSLILVRRDPSSARADLQSMLIGLKGRLDGPPRGGVYFSCVARGPNMFASADEEMALIAQTLGPVPIIGFYGNGEISKGRLYGYTGVLSLFA
jgi:small ligand-binding sensory domain FIST